MVENKAVSFLLKHIAALEIELQDAHALIRKYQRECLHEWEHFPRHPMDFDGYTQHCKICDKYR